MPSKVYFLELEDGVPARVQARAIGRIFEAAQVSKLISKKDLVAIKLHVGEKGNTTYLKPDLVAEIVKRVKAAGGLPFLTETSTLYKGQRENAVKHILLAHGHGFSIEKTGAPFIVADGLVGTAEAEVEIQGEIYQKVRVAREVLSADVLLVLSHPTGHPGTGMGACIKNLGMGLASRAGKMRQHSAISPEVREDRCVNCGKCRKWCPTGAIKETMGKSFIDSNKCMGCGECIAVCRFEAIKYDFGVGSTELQKRMAEYALGSLKGKGGKSFFFNILVDMTKDCDCFNLKQDKLIKDIGILASNDPVAIDKATIDVIQEKAGSDLAGLSYPQLDPMIQILHAEKLGMGSTSYVLERIPLVQGHETK